MIRGSLELERLRYQHSEMRAAGSVKSNALAQIQLQLFCHGASKVCYGSIGQTEKRATWGHDTFRTKASVVEVSACVLKVIGASQSKWSLGNDTFTGLCF